MTTQWRLPDGHYFCDPVNPEGPGFDSDASDDGRVLLWRGMEFTWNDDERRYERLGPGPGEETFLYTYTDGTYLYVVHPSGPVEVGTWAAG